MQGIFLLIFCIINTKKIKLIKDALLSTKIQLFQNPFQHKKKIKNTIFGGKNNSIC